MPYAAPTLCAEPGCHALVRSGRCDAHRADERPSAARRGYGRRWRATRARVLEGEPLCRRCVDQGKPKKAVEVHHRVKRRDRGSDNPGRLVRMHTKLGWLMRWTGNLEPLCKSCHSAATRRGE